MELVSLAGVDVIVSMLQEFKKEENLQDYGVRVLCNLSAVGESIHSADSFPLWHLGVPYHFVLMHSSIVSGHQLLCDVHHIV